MCVQTVGLITSSSRPIWLLARRCHYIIRNQVLPSITFTIHIVLYLHIFDIIMINMEYTLYNDILLYYYIYQITHGIL